MCRFARTDQRKFARELPATYVEAVGLTSSCGRAFGFGKLSKGRIRRRGNGGCRRRGCRDCLADVHCGQMGSVMGAEGFELIGKIGKRGNDRVVSGDQLRLGCHHGRAQFKVGIVAACGVGGIGINHRRTRTARRHCTQKDDPTDHGARRHEVPSGHGERREFLHWSIVTRQTDRLSIGSAVSPCLSDVRSPYARQRRCD